MTSHDPKVYPERDGNSLTHLECKGEVEAIPEHGLYCLTCNKVIKTIETSGE